MSGGSLEALRSRGYNVVEALRIPGSRPAPSQVRFEELHPGFASTRLRGRRLYRHQLEAVKALERGSLVLVSGTGSGKTEAWLAWAASMAARGVRVRVLAVYPTLALAWDQLSRLHEYSQALGIPVAAVDSVAKRSVRGLRARVRGAWIVATNPAMLMHELKKHLAEPGSALLSPLLQELDLLVLDELDYYDPRGVALLLAMAELLATMSSRLRVAVLSATLANPEELAAHLARATGRPATVVEGEPFRAETRVLVVLGKDLEGLRRRLLEEAERRGLKLPGEIAGALRDPTVFPGKAYIVVEYLKAQGVEAPEPAPDPVEVLEVYARGEAEPQGLTLAFTRSINEAERLVRALREILGPGAPVAAHHHLVPKEERAWIEEAARRGELRLIVTPRTLTQGIDIGGVVRIVQVGLPRDVREFWQREGRKGRREGIEYAESIIIPRGRWDRQLLEQGLDALMDWLSLPLERVQINPGNHYKALFTGAAKLLSPMLRALGAELTRLEREALEAAGVFRDGRLDHSALQRLWERLNFYEYGPPYGVKRVLEDPGGGWRRELEEIGRCDLVEKFQPGCLDPAHDAVVARLVHPPGRPRSVQRVVEWPLRSALEAREPEWLMDAVENYRWAKERWGEEPRLLRDYASGLLASESLAIVYPPRRGFGLLVKRPHRCVWRVQARKPRALEAGGGVRVYRPREVFALDAPVAGEYRDYTYGLLVEAPEGAPSEMLRLGLAVLGVYLRRAVGVPLGLVKYSVYTAGERRLLEVHEESAAGLLDSLDWASIASGVAGWRPERLDEVLLLAVDEHAYAALQGLGYRWEAALEWASRVAGLLAARQSLEVRLPGFRVRVPRPGRHLGRAAIAAISHPVESPGVMVPLRAVAVAYYDGSETLSAADVVVAGSTRPPEPLAELEYRVYRDKAYEGLQLYAFNPEVEARELEAGGLKILASLAREARCLRCMTEELGLQAESPSWLTAVIEAGGVELEEPRLERVVEALSEPVRGARLTRRQEEALRSYVEDYARLVYLASLALEKLLEERRNKEG